MFHCTWNEKKLGLGGFEGVQFTVSCFYGQGLYLLGGQYPITCHAIETKRRFVSDFGRILQALKTDLKPNALRAFQDHKNIMVLLPRSKSVEKCVIWLPFSHNFFFGAPQ